MQCGEVLHLLFIFSNQNVAVVIYRKRGAKKVTSSQPQSENPLMKITQVILRNFNITQCEILNNTQSTPK